MIIDTLKNCEIYYGMNLGFEKAFDFIKVHCYLCGNVLFCIIHEYFNEINSFLS